MSNPLSIQALPPSIGSGDTTAPIRPNTQTQLPAAPEAKPVQLFVNPSFQFDPTVGLVVIAFHDDSGKVKNSIPSERQLEAYRLHQEALPGEQAPRVPKLPQPIDDKTSSG